MSDAGDKDGAYAGGALGGLLMLALAVFPVVRWLKADCAKALASTAGSGGPTWRNYVLLSLALYLYGACCQAYSGASDYSKYGKYATISVTGIFGGACFCAFATMCVATTKCIKVASAAVSQNHTKWIHPLMALAWTCHMLALAIIGFGYVHVYTIEKNVQCEKNASKDKDVTYTFAGLTDLVAFFCSLLAIAVCLRPGGAQSALAASADVEAGTAGDATATQSKCPKWCPCGTPNWSQLGFTIVMAALMLLTSATAFEHTLESPIGGGTSKSNQQAAFAIPGLVMMFACVMLLLASFFKLKNAATRGQNKHATAFDLSLALYSLAFFLVLYVNSDAIDNPNFSKMHRDVNAFACVALLSASFIVAFPTFAACKGRVMKIAQERKLAVENSEPYKSMTHLFSAAWACTLFAIGVMCGQFSNSLNGATDAKGGYFVAGTSFGVGFCFLYYAALFGVAPSTAPAAPATSADAPRPEPRFDPATGKPITKRNSNSQFVAPAVGSPGAPARVDDATAATAAPQQSS
jgi:hypothetical protein